MVQLAAYIAQHEPGKRGFSSQNLWRMRQFFEAYPAAKKLSPLVRVLPWTHNLTILAQTKRADERNFYLRMAAQQRWGKRELERQIRLAAFETAVLRQPKLSPAVREMHGDVADICPQLASCIQLRITPLPSRACIVSVATARG